MHIRTKPKCARLKNIEPESLAEEVSEFLHEKLDSLSRILGYTVEPCGQDLASDAVEKIAMFAKYGTYLDTDLNTIAVTLSLAIWDQSDYTIDSIHDPPDTTEGRLLVVLRAAKCRDRLIKEQFVKTMWLSALCGLSTKTIRSKITKGLIFAEKDVKEKKRPNGEVKQYWSYKIDPISALKFIRENGGKVGQWGDLSLI